MTAVRDHTLTNTLSLSLSQEPSSLGMCWPMVGRSGTLTVRLASPTRVDAVSIEHYPAAANPHRKTAPKTFSLWALASVDDASPAAVAPARGVAFRYDVHAGRHVQTFAVQEPSVSAAAAPPPFTQPRPLTADSPPLPFLSLARRSRSASCSCAWRTTGARRGTPASTASACTGRRPSRAPARVQSLLALRRGQPGECEAAEGAPGNGADGDGHGVLLPR